MQNKSIKKLNGAGINEETQQMNVSLAREQEIQEEQYAFPYHYIPRNDKNGFSIIRSLRWGYEYMAYIEFVLSKLSHMQFDSLLDVGCGDGRFLYEIKKIFPEKQLFGLDYSEKAIAFAKAFNPRVNFICGDITDNTLLRQKFDVITLIETVEHVPPDTLKTFLSGIAHRLNDDGVLLLTVPSKNIPLQKKHFQHFNQETLTQALPTYFSIAEIFFINKLSIANHFIETILSNRIFALNNKIALKSIFALYKKYLFNGTEHNTKRIVVFCKKNSN